MHSLVDNPIFVVLTAQRDAETQPVHQSKLIELFNTPENEAATSSFTHPSIWAEADEIAGSMRVRTSPARPPGVGPSPEPELPVLIARLGPRPPVSAENRMKLSQHRDILKAVPESIDGENDEEALGALKERAFSMRYMGAVKALKCVSLDHFEMEKRGSVISRTF
jgi:hypothetical protein